MKKFKIYDSFELKIPKRQCKQLRDSVEDKQALLVKIDATHGGYINGNKFYYNVDSMEDATKTWVKPFQKPVLIHHDEDSDPIGRVTDAQYQPISTNRRNKPKGRIQLTLRITDADAIEKILDGRYMTVSVSSWPTSAFCNICDRDVVKDGLCNHKRGQVYDNKECFLKVNIKDYSEVSFVNKPADEYQHGIESIEMADRTEEDEDIITFDKEINKAEFYLEDSENTEDDKEENEDDKDLELNIDNIDSTWTQDDIDMIQQIMEEMNEELSDAKLTTKQRKKLAASTFCGPNRSFPVNDCAHYTAAKRLLGRYKGPGDKSRILSCIERRGKSMGCKGATKSKDSNEEDNTMSEELQKQVDELKTKVTDLETEAQTLKDEKESLESQLNTKSEEINTLNDKIIAFEADKHNNLVDKLFDLRVKLGKKDVKDLNAEDSKTFKENLSKRTNESISDSISDLELEVEKDEGKEPTEKVEKESKDNKDEKQTEIKDEKKENTETEIKDLSDLIKK